MPTRDEIDAALRRLRDLSAAEQEAELARLELEALELHKALLEELDADLDADDLPRSPVQPMAPDPCTLKKGDIVDGRYEIQKRLGEGGGGSVYLAHAIEVFGPGPPRRLAVKVAKPGTEEYMYKEALVLAEFKHPNAPRLESPVKVGQCVGIVMEYIKGDSLHDLFKGHKGGFPEADVLTWMDTVLDVLSDFHRLRLGNDRNPTLHGGLEPPGNGQDATPPVHCDIKPANLVLESKGGEPGDRKLVVVDFGVARTGNPVWSPHPNVNEARAGTPGFAPPEFYPVWDGGDGVNPVPQSDLYSVGMTSFALLTGTAVHSTPSFQAPTRISGHKKGRDPFAHALDNAELSERAREWIRKATQLRVEDRFPTADAMREALHAPSPEPPVPDPAPAPGREGRGGRWKHRAPIAVAVAFAVGFAALLYSLGPIQLVPAARLPPSPDSTNVERPPLAKNDPADKDPDPVDPTPLDPPEVPPGAVPLPAATPVRDSPTTPPPQREEVVQRPSPPPSEPAPTVQTAQVALTSSLETESGVVALVGGRAASSLGPLTVGETYHFEAPDGWEIAEAKVKGAGSRTVRSTDGTLPITIAEGTTSIEFRFVQRSEARAHDGTDS